MAETDILNPPDWQSQGMPWNPNPGYGFSRKLGANRQTQRPRLGTFASRDVGNAGHSFTLQWIGVPLWMVQRILQFYHSFKHGYFTLIDADNNGRHYVGRFMSEPEQTHTANGKYSIQGLVFEEVPTARMLNYPSDWQNDGHTINVVDDFLNPLVATMQGDWVPNVVGGSTAGVTSTAPSAYEMYDFGGAVGDWAQLQYTGWGFQIAFRLSGTLGAVDIFLDGVQLVTGLDLSSGATASASSPLVTLAVTPGAAGPVTLTVTIRLSRSASRQGRLSGCVRGRRHGHHLSAAGVHLLMQSYLAQVAARQLASGGAAGISLLELQTIAGNRYYWSDAKLAAPSELAVFDNPVIIRRTAETPNAPPPPNVQFVPWILTPPSFHSFRSTQTATGTVVIQNVTGDTVRRDAAQIFSQFELLGSLFIYRLWLTDCEFATDVVQGTVDEVVIEADGDSISSFAGRFL